MCTVDYKYFVHKNFVLFNFHGQSQPQKLNMDCMYTCNFVHKYRRHSYYGYA